VRDVRGTAATHEDAHVRALVRVAIAVTERPWALAPEPDLPREHFEHAVLQSAIFGHLNRIADAVDVPADYPDDFGAPHAEPSTPPYARAPRVLAGAFDFAKPPFDAWRAHAYDRDAPLSRRERALIAGVVAAALGDANVPSDAPASQRERAIVALAETVTLAPWRLNQSAYSPLRVEGLVDDSAIFDVVATASAAGFFSRIRVAFGANGQHELGR
jgi:hypothetical protein